MPKRTVKGRFSIGIDFTACGNCGACVAVCPENVLHLGPIRLESADADCTGCKFCIITCPADALELRHER